MKSLKLPTRPEIRQDLVIRPIEDDHREWLRSRVQEIWDGRFVVSRGIRHEPADLPGFLAFDGDEIVGVTTYHIHDAECELVTLDALSKWQGVGTALIEAVEEEARREACGRMWMITTNDNIDGLRFYQRRGYVICKVHPNAIDDSRKIKPSIPLVGNYGIEIRDEIELEKNLYCWIGW